MEASRSSKGKLYLRGYILLIEKIDIFFYIFVWLSLESIPSNFHWKVHKNNETIA